MQVSQWTEISRTWDQQNLCEGVTQEEGRAHTRGMAVQRAQQWRKEATLMVQPMNDAESDSPMKVERRCGGESGRQYSSPAQCQRDGNAGQLGLRL